MQRLVLLLTLALAATAGGRAPRCGGVLTAARGLLATPGFPRPFAAPLRCEWVIDATHTATPNASIVVYLTQLYVHEGLTFTEYQLYDKTYQLAGRVVHTVNETNVVRVRWVQSFQNYLVVRLQLESGDGVHLRVLDRLLDVYGFNVTYEIVRGAAVRGDSCTMMDCGFTGICYDHFTKFSCDCFPGYSGPRCSSGPSSFCTNTTCQNGGTCIHVGVSAVKCHCQKGFVGDICQTSASSIKALECENCIVSCPFDGRIENACKCTNGYTNTTSTSSVERIGFTCTMHLSNLPNLEGDPLKMFIENQIFKTLKTNYSKLEEVRLENIAYFRSGADVTFHLFASKKADEKRIRTILNKWLDRGYIANLTVPDKEFVFGPLLDLQSVSINQQGIIRQNDEFILSCVARGSPSMSFRWFKNGIFVNVTELTSHKWSRLIRDPHLDDQYTALLGVARSHMLDAGLFTCQVEDFGMQQCLSRRVHIKAQPLIKVEPMSLTVRKGDNFTIKCISMGPPLSKYTYSWTKNKLLLPVRSDTEKYEILYPGGSILQVTNMEKSAKFSCLVQDDATSTEIAVEVSAVDARLVRTCANETLLGAAWPETAPDTDALLECPKGYVFPGFVRRTCSLKDGLAPVWSLPDYAECTSERLRRIVGDFELLQLGYETGGPIDILGNCLSYLETQSKHGVLLPGESSRILYLIRDVIAYTKRLRFIPENLTNVVFDLIDCVLVQPHALINQLQVKLLQEVVNQQIELSIRLLPLLETKTELNVIRSTIDIHLIPIEPTTKLTFTNSNKSGQVGGAAAAHRKNVQKQQEPNKWTIRRMFNLQFHEKISTITNVGIEARVKNQAVGLVLYRSLDELLPNRSVIRLKDGAEVEYELISQIARIYAIKDGMEHEIDWHIDTILNTTNREGWFVRCAMAETALFAYAWNTTVCRTQTINSTMLRCKCPGSGTLALLYTTTNIQVEKEEHHPTRYVILAGCALCLLSSLTCTIILTINWLLKRSCIIFLKLQCSLSIVGVMSTFCLATIADPPTHLYANLLALVELLLLMAMSAHVSTLLMVYAEIVQVRRDAPAASRPIVIGISTGVPVIAVFGSHLAHRTMDVRLTSWWLVVGSLAFQIFVTVSIVIIGLVLLLYFTVVGKMKKLMVVHEKDGKILRKRISLLKRSALVFIGVVAVSGSSIAYINFSDVIWWHYEFAIVTMILGLILIISYVIKSETKPIWSKFSKSKRKENFFGVECTGSPLNFFTKEEADLESESTPNIRQTHQKTIECFPMTDTCTLPECVSSALDSASSTASSTYAAAAAPLRRYHRSPQPPRKSITFKIDEGAAAGAGDAATGRKPPPIKQAPDVIATKTFNQLDLVASHAPTIVITPEWEAAAAEEAARLRGAQRAQPTEAKEELDGMLARIGHDLDYLLDRGGGVVAVGGGGGRRSLMEEVIVEEVEEEGKLPEAITDILRTSC